MMIFFLRVKMKVMIGRHHSVEFASQNAYTKHIPKPISHQSKKLQRNLQPPSPFQSHRIRSLETSSLATVDSLPCGTQPHGNSHPSVFPMEFDTQELPPRGTRPFGTRPPGSIPDTRAWCGFRGPSLGWTFMFLGVENVVNF